MALRGVLEFVVVRAVDVKTVSGHEGLLGNLLLVGHKAEGQAAGGHMRFALHFPPFR